LSALSFPPRRPVGRIFLAREERPRPAPVLRVGVLGGSFNPAHDGHLYVSAEARRRLGLDLVWWLVSPLNPLKSEREMAPLARRLAQARALTAGHPYIRVSALEAQMGTRYTVDTLTRLRRLRNLRLVFLLGADNLLQLPRWRQWWRLFLIMPIAVFERSPYAYPALAGAAARRFAPFRLPEIEARTLVDREPPAWVFIRLRPHPASATAIRHRQGTAAWAGGRE